jgi:hypothetical protein
LSFLKNASAKENQMQIEMLFKGDCLEDKEHFLQIMHCSEIACALSDIRQSIRCRLKHGEIEEKETQFLETLVEIICATSADTGIEF